MRHRSRGPGLSWVRSGLDAGLIADPDARISHVLLNDLLVGAVEDSGLPELGLLAAEQVPPGHFDLFELVARSRATLGEVLTSMPRLIPLLHDGLLLDVHEDGEFTDVRVGLSPGLELHPAGYDFILAIMMISMRRSTGQRDLQMSEVSFPYPMGDDCDAHRRVFDCPLRFGQPFAALRLSTHALSLRMVHASPTVNAALDRVATDLIAAGQTKEDFGARVATAISEELSSGRGCTGGSVAKRLGVAPRTLQRRLGEQGTSFREVLDGQRQRLARAYLEQPELSLAEIAYLLGFATSQAFHRAFKRWTGKTPSAYRSEADR